MTRPQALWHPTRTLTTWLSVLLAAEAVLSLASLGQGTSRSLDGIASGFDALLNGQNKLAETRFEHASDGNAFPITQVVGYVAVAFLVVVIIWQWRSQTNARALGRDGERISPGWGIAGWLIPLVNLVLPYLVFQDLWRSSDEQSEPGTHWRVAPGLAARDRVVDCVRRRHPGADGGDRPRARDDEHGRRHRLAE